MHSSRTLFSMKKIPYLYIGLQDPRLKSHCFGFPICWIMSKDYSRYASNTAGRFRYPLIRFSSGTNYVVHVHWKQNWKLIQHSFVDCSLSVLPKEPSNQKQDGHFSCILAEQRAIMTNCGLQCPVWKNIKNLSQVSLWKWNKNGTAVAIQTPWHRWSGSYPCRYLDSLESS